VHAGGDDRSPLAGLSGLVPFLFLVPCARHGWFLERLAEPLSSAAALRVSAVGGGGAPISFRRRTGAGAASVICLLILLVKLRNSTDRNLRFICLTVCAFLK